MRAAVGDLIRMVDGDKARTSSALPVHHKAVAARKFAATPSPAKAAPANLKIQTPRLGAVAKAAATEGGLSPDANFINQ